jgi:hypothetical protein
MKVLKYHNGLYHYIGGMMVKGAHSGLTGDYSALTGNCTNIRGVATDKLFGNISPDLRGDITGIKGWITHHVTGNLDDISEEDRKKEPCISYYY